jgi:hypothetical protein
MPFASVRNYLAERLSRVTLEWQRYQSTGRDPQLTEDLIQDSDVRRHYQTVSAQNRNDEALKILNAEMSTIVEAYRLDYQTRHQPFELHKPFSDGFTLPENRVPQSGIKFVPYEYHSGHIIHENPETSRPLDPDYDTDAAESYLPGDIDFGSYIDEPLQHLIHRKYPIYQQYIAKYCRPAGTTNGTFRDFNKEQKPSEPIDPVRKEHVLLLVDHFLDTTPFLPIHFVDTQYAKLPLVTGTGYHNRFSFKQRAHAKYSHPIQYADRPTSKGYFYNATYENARTLVHKIKETGMPFNLAYAPDDPTLTDDQIFDMIKSYEKFFLDYPTLLFTRNHISQRERTLKVRPVYAVDDLFLIIETMLTFPLLVQARKPSCCIMYGLETVRGSNRYLDQLARQYLSYFTIDWSGYDQHLPRTITDVYYTDFLRRKIVISHGYAPTYEYPHYPDLNEHTMYKKMDNLLHFLHLWYNNLVYLSVDGFAYWRLYAGVPSGLLNTQYLDSFANIFILVDGMIEFGLTDAEIKSLVLFVLGDDNSGFTPWTISTLTKFITFLESYALHRYHMVLSRTKSVITTLRSKIESLGYQCNHGHPKRDIGKLVAQLCYPEHGIRPHTMSARAIGMVYASCGQDRQFYQFCYDVFCTYLPYYRQDARVDLELQYRILGDTETPLPFETSHLEFPTFLTVRKLFDSYQGPLAYAPKWNYAHFINGPDVVPPSAKTMHDYELEHNIVPRQAPTFRAGSDLPF